MKSNDNYRGHRDELREAERIAKQHDVERRIKEENAEFQAMTPAQKRVRIAKDVLEWMEVGRLVATNGEYFHLEDDSGRRRAGVVTNGFECHACALGAVFACAVERGMVRGATRGLGGYGWEMREKLIPYFDEQQLLEIEDAFESFCDSGPVGLADNPKAETFCYGIDGTDRDDLARRRMTKIMSNIIANDGTFIP